jgi:hypothetical protein
VNHHEWVREDGPRELGKGFSTVPNTWRCVRCGARSYSLSYKPSPFSLIDRLGRAGMGHGMRCDEYAVWSVLSS